MNKNIYLAIVVVLCICISGTSFASSSFIEGITKIRKSDGYTFKINYQTTQEWTDGLVFKLFCTFSKGGEISFTSSGYNNIKKGWHNTEIKIPKVYRDRYGFISDYRIEMYCKGILISIKSM